MNRSIPHVMYQMNAHTCRPAQVFKLNHQFLERHTSDDDDFLKPDNANRRLEGNQMKYKITRRDRINGVIQPNNGMPRQQVIRFLLYNL